MGQTLIDGCENGRAVTARARGADHRGQVVEAKSGSDLAGPARLLHEHGPAPASLAPVADQAPVSRFASVGPCEGIKDDGGARQARRQAAGAPRAGAARVDHLR